jgi:hypothetical protein
VGGASPGALWMLRGSLSLLASLPLWVAQSSRAGRRRTALDRPRSPCRVPQRLRRLGTVPRRPWGARARRTPPMLPRNLPSVPSVRRSRRYPLSE